MKRILGLAGLTLAFSGTAAATDLGLTYDLSNLLAPTGDNTSVGVSYYLDDSSEVIVGLDMSYMGEEFSINEVDVTYLMHGEGDGIRSLMGGGVIMSDVTGDLGLSVGGGVGFQSDLGFFDNASVRGWTGLQIGITPDVVVASVSSNLSLHYKFGL